MLVNHGGSVKRRASLKRFCYVLAPLTLLSIFLLARQDSKPVPVNRSYMSPGGQDISPWWQSFPDRRTIFLQPSCGLGNQLVSIASALTTARREKVNLKIVFRAWDDPENNVRWSDMFSEPRIDYYDSFPDGSFLSYNTTSKVFDLGEMIKWNGMKMTWADIENEFSRDPNGKLFICMPVCLWQEGSFPSDEAWFYKLLKPTTEINNMIESFKKSVRWEQYQWVGVHLRRGDRMADLSAYWKEQNNTAELLPLDNYVTKMKSVKSMLPSHLASSSQEIHDFLLRFESLDLDRMGIRFFVATDDPLAAEYIKSFFAVNEVVLFDQKVNPAMTMKHVQDAQSALADLFLLASCEALIGTPTSSFSLAAKLIGSGLYTEPELFAAE